MSCFDMASAIHEDLIQNPPNPVILLAAPLSCTPSSPVSPELLGKCLSTLSVLSFDQAWGRLRSQLNHQQTPSSFPVKGSLSWLASVVNRVDPRSWPERLIEVS